MTIARVVFALACSVAGLGTASAASAQFAPPNPEVYARPEDQQRARLIRTPCAEADIGRGCYRYNDRLVREGPCTYHTGDGAIASTPTDQCYKMEKPRRFKGIWVDAFEGQAFIPEGTKAPEWPTTDPTSPGWREQFERARAARIWLHVGQAVAPAKRGTGRRMLIEFVGRKTLYPGEYGHFGMSGQEIIVDRVISLKECPTKTCEG